MWWEYHVISLNWLVCHRVRIHSLWLAAGQGRSNTVRPHPGTMSTGLPRHQSTTGTDPPLWSTTTCIVILTFNIWVSGFISKTLIKCTIQYLTSSDSFFKYLGVHLAKSVAGMSERPFNINTCSLSIRVCLNIAWICHWILSPDSKSIFWTIPKVTQ